MKKHRKNSGSIFLVVLILSLVATIAAVHTFRTVMFQSRMADETYRFHQALMVAEAGIEQGLHRLNHLGSEEENAIPFGSQHYYSYESLSDENGQTIGEYSLTINHLMTKTPILECIAYVPNGQEAIAARTIQVYAVLNREPTYFNWGIFAYGDLHFSGGFDMVSWDSLEGAYKSAANQNNTYGNIGGMGDAFFANGTKVYGSVEVGGAITGPNNLIRGVNVDGQPNQLLPGSDPKQPPSYPDENHEAARLNNDNLTGITPPDGMTLDDIYDPATQSLSLTKNNETIILEPGVYFFSEISLSGNSSEILVRPEGEVTIFMEGPANQDVFYVNNTADINADGKARNFQVFVKSGNIYWENAGTIHAAVFAPTSDIQVDNAFQLFGSMTGNNVNIMGGGMTVYDEDLGRPTQLTNNAVVGAWNEIPMGKRDGYFYFALPGGQTN